MSFWIKSQKEPDTQLSFTEDLTVLPEPGPGSDAVLYVRAAILPNRAGTGKKQV
jgi:hypothetical protein